MTFKRLAAKITFKTQFGNFTSGCISSENVFVAPTRKGGTLPKLAEKNFSLSSRKESSFYGTKVRNCTATLSQIIETLTRQLNDNEQLLRLKRMSKSPHSNPLFDDLASL